MFLKTPQARPTKLVLFPLAICLMVYCPEACADDDEYSSFQKAQNAYAGGDYIEAVARFENLVQREFANPALRLECHKFLAISYLFINKKNAAEEQFTKLLTFSPEYSLDPLLFPIEIIDFFTEVQMKNKKQLEALALARAREKEQRKAAEEAKRKAEIEKLRRNIYLEKDYRINLIPVALIPYGVGQFQNGHRKKGIFFLSSELFFTATAIATYFLHGNLRKEAKKPFKMPKDRKKYENRELLYRVSNYVSFITMGTLMISGLVDALHYYKPQVVRWKNIDQKEVPKHLRPGGSIGRAFPTPSFFASKDTIGLQLGGKF
jgi:hypothetical protein